jgi:medium-chain acyl-[acyl-carrier-protein] hydrolase
MSLADWTVVPRRSADPRVRLLCLPYAGGTAGVYRPWADILPPDVEVHAVQMPGREWRIKEAPARRVEAVVEPLLEVVAGLADRPLALFGHSLGALISFELVRAMRRAGMDEPAHLFVSAHRAPQLEPIEPRLHDASDETFMDSLRNLQGTPEELLANEELMALLLPALRADFEIADMYEYVPEPPLSCPVSAFGGVADVVTPRERLEPWGELTDGPFKLRMLPGGHFFVNDARDLVLRALFGDLMTVRA